MTGSTPRLHLNDGHSIPQLGFGVFQIPPGETAAAALHALRSGYRALDTAAAYNNEAELAAGIAGSGLEREAVFVTTKLWNSEHGHDRTARAFEASLGRLGLDYVDLYLIHWPVPSRGLYAETWQALCELRTEGRARSIGVSNFALEHLERIIDASGVVPAVNQIELHPRLQQARLRDFHERHGILTEAWSPLGQGAILDEPLIARIASELDRTPAQVVLRWHVQLGNVAIPKSVTPERIEQNLRIFDFELGEEHMHAIGELDAGGRIGPDPETFAVV